jgi:hypothetical protein
MAIFKKLEVPALPQFKPTDGAEYADWKTVNGTTYRIALKIDGPYEPMVAAQAIANAMQLLSVSTPPLIAEKTAMPNTLIDWSNHTPR